MKIIHRIGIHADENQKRILKKIGIEIPIAHHFTVFELEEDSKEYILLQPYIQQWNLLDAVGTQFYDEELNNARLLAFRDCWTNGFPMPDSNEGYKSTTYDDHRYCSSCGIGLIQKDSFTCKNAPKWGSRQIFMLNWIYDELFVRKQLYQAVFEKYSLACRPVKLFKNDTYLEDVVQLVIPTTTFHLELHNYSYHDCIVCNRRKYDLINRGFFPPFEQSLENTHLVKTAEYFGAGSNARKYILCSKQLRDELQKYLVPISFIPQAAHG